MALSVTDVDNAIQAVLKGQSYTLPDGTSVTRANLDSLRHLRDQLQAEAAEASRQSIYVPLSMGRPH